MEYSLFTLLSIFVSFSLGLAIARTTTAKTYSYKTVLYKTLFFGFTLCIASIPTTFYLLDQQLNKAIADINELPALVSISIENDQTIKKITQKKPELKNIIQQKAKNGYKTKGSKGAHQQIEKTFQKIMINQLPHYIEESSDQAAIDYMKNYISFLKELKNESTTLCWQWLTSEAEWDTALVNIRKNTLKNLLSSIDQIVETSVKDKHPLPNEDVILLSLKTLLKSTRNELGNRFVFPAYKNTDKDKPKACTTMIKLYENMVSLPANQSGSLIRYTVSRYN